MHSNDGKSNCNLPVAASESARGELPRELVSRSLSSVKPLPTSYESHFSAYFPPSELAAAKRNDCDFVFGPIETNAVIRGKSQGEGIQVLRGNSIADRGDSRHFGEKELKTENFHTRIYENAMPSSSSLASAASGVKSDDKCAPASNIRPEINAQNIRATEIENACPYTS